MSLAVHALRVVCSASVLVSLAACVVEAPSSGVARRSPGVASKAGDTDDATDPSVSAPSSADGGPDAVTTAPVPLVASGYYTGYGQVAFPAAEVSFAALSELIHFGLVPRADGTLDEAANVIDAARSSAVVAAAHAKNQRATITVGGAASRTAFVGASSSARRAAFVANIVTFAQSRGYDGVDIDWEPLQADDKAAYVALAAELRAALDAAAAKSSHARYRLTTAVIASEGSIAAAAIGSLDAVHLMSYDQSGPYLDWVTWHNASLSAGGATFPKTGGPLPSVEGDLDALLGAGVPKEKVLLGISWLGYAWKGGTGTAAGGVTEPRQAWTTAPTMTPITYRDVLKLATPAVMRRDTVASVPFLSIDLAGSANDQFVSYEDAASQRDKVMLAKKKGLRGVFVWDLAAAHLDAGAADRDPLLSALASAIAAP